VRWRLIDRDTVVEVPYARLVLWAANRDAEAQMRRDVAWKLRTASDLVQEQTLRIDLLQGRATVQDSLLLQQKVVIGSLNEDVASYKSKADKLRTWATVGKISFVLCAATAVYTIVHVAR
jgi:hypothetical protein